MYPSYKNTSQDPEFADAGLRFQSQIEENKLFIRVYDEMNVLKYVGSMDALPNIDLEVVSKKLEEGKVEIQHRNENHLSIKVMELININLESVSKKQKNLMQQRIKKLEERQNQYEKKIENQTSQIKQVSRLIKEFKQSYPGNIKSVRQQLRLDYEEKINLINSRIENQTSQIKQVSNFTKKLKQYFVESLNSIVQQLRLKYLKKIDQHANKIQQLQSNKMEIQQFIKQKKQILNAIEEHGLTIDNIKNKQLVQVGNLITELQTQIKLNSTRISSCAAQLSKQQNKINLQNDTIQGIKFKLQHLCKVSLNQSFFNQPTISSKWSYTLKSSKIEISQNKIKSTVGYVGFLDKSLFTYWQFCFLNASFSNTLKTKQSWAIKINNIIGLDLFGSLFEKQNVKIQLQCQKYQMGRNRSWIVLDWFRWWLLFSFIERVQLCEQQKFCIWQQ